MKTIGLLLVRKLIETKRNPAFIFMGIITPILYLGLFSPLLKDLPISKGFPNANTMTIFVPGMLTLLAFSGGLWSGFGIIDELRSGIIERFRVTPISRFSILAGVVLHDVLVTLASTIFFVLIALPFGFTISITGFILIILLLMLLIATVSSFSNATGLITKSEDKLAPITHGINMPIMLLSGMTLPMSLAPDWLKIVAHFNPVYYVVEATRHLAMGNYSNSMVMYAFMIMIVICALTMTWATRIFSKAVM